MLNASQQVDQQVVRNADEAAAAALRMAMLAAGQGTFAVGGLIVHNGTGEVIHAMHNSVLRKLPHGKGFTWDPTAHGERQLVYWYFENRAARSLPPPSELTIVTSLDPCVMCTGAILAAGFNVGVVALDDYAGINWNKRFQLTSLPDKLRAQASKSFGYYACGNPATDPRGYVRKYEGGAGPVFHADRVTAHNLLGCDLIFRDSANAVRDLSSKESGVEPKDLKDPASLPEDSPIKQAYRRIYPNAFKIKNASPS
jgi:cytosine deaminase